ncbi:concanavalin A-like lectin/glucanase domain-containing protein [Dichotomocladium elegans]|nr:concanavalin A-like lectin/glucanase domain-containing protein [Dichotomocladium elegans]
MLQAVQASPAVRRGPSGKVECRNYKTDFSKSMDGWVNTYGGSKTYTRNGNGLEMKIMPPSQYVRKFDENQGLPYNQEAGQGPTFNATTYMHYGKFTARAKTTPVGGAVTAMILIGDGSDEIDFELIGADGTHAQSNFFWGKKIVYGKNGKNHEVPGDQTHEAFHDYTIDWSPDRIIWSIDGQPVRTLNKADTCEANGVCKYPTQPSRIQLGLWDGSTEPGTAQWAWGPIDWSKHDSITAYIKSVESECNPEYNTIIS